jgi:hypothetical protein
MMKGDKNRGNLQWNPEYPVRPEALSKGIARENRSNNALRPNGWKLPRESQTKPRPFENDHHDHKFTPALGTASFR